MPAEALGRIEPPVVDVVVPVHNEAHVLADRVGRLHEYLRGGFPFTWRITIVDNASSDGTAEMADELAARLCHVVVRRLPEKGRGRALRAAWTASDAAVVAYMDVDLSTGLDALLPVVAPLVSGHSDLAVGSRLLPNSRVVRGPRRELISRAYNLLLHLVLNTRVRDAQCGFKAVRADVAAALVPAVADEAWFFDTELLVLAERAGLRVTEVAVDWVDDPDSRVDIVTTAREDLRGIARLACLLWARPVPVALGAAARPAPPTGTGGELVVFGAVGTACSALYLAAYLRMRRDGMVPIIANAVGLTATMVVSTAAHRRLTFGQRGAEGRGRQWARAAGVHAAALGLTTAAIAVVGRRARPAPAATETAVVLLASTGASALRFLLMPGWIFGPPSALAATAPGSVPSKSAMKRRGLVVREVAP